MLNALLEKLGLSYDTLKPAEKQVYEAWAKTLSVKDVSIDDLKAFLSREQEKADAECRNRENAEKTQLYVQMYATLVSDIRSFLEGPSRQREELKSRLKQQFNIDM